MALLDPSEILMHEMMHETSLIFRGDNLTSEDKSIAATTGFLATQTDQFWAGIFAVEVVIIVWFLSVVNLNDKKEDVNIYQALPLAFLWSAVGIGLIIFNKLLFLPDGVGFGFPFAVFLMWFHALVGIVASNMMRFLRPDILPAVAGNKLSLRSYFVNICPVACLQGTSLATGNVAYLYLSVAYIQMVKNTTSAFVYIFCIMLSLERGSTSATIAITLVVGGLVMTSYGELTFTLIGFMFQMAATTGDALRLALTKIILSSDHAVRLDPVSALYYSAPTMFVFLTIPMLLWDAPFITMAKVWDLKFVLLCNSLVAFGLNVTSMFFIKRCGPTTYALTGVMKDIVLILISCAAFGHAMTGLQFGGFVVSFAGFQLYNKLKEDPKYLEKLCAYFGISISEQSEESSEELEPLMAEKLLKKSATCASNTYLVHLGGEQSPHLSEAAKGP